MSYFRNVELDGKWEAGGTYTFEVYEPISGFPIDGGWLINPYTGVCSWYAAGVGNCVSCDQAEGDMLYSDTDLLIDEDCHGGSFAPSAGLVGNILFDNNDANLDGGVEGTEIIDKEDTEDERWYKYTITLPADIPNGTYYFKRKNFSYPVIIVIV